MNIEKRRIAAGLSQRQLSRLVGVQQNTISQYEKGKREPSLEVLIKLADIFGCTIDELVRGEKNERTKECL